MSGRRRSALEGNVLRVHPVLRTIPKMMVLSEQGAVATLEHRKISFTAQGPPGAGGSRGCHFQSIDDERQKTKKTEKWEDKRLCLVLGWGPTARSPQVVWEGTRRELDVVIIEIRVQPASQVRVASDGVITQSILFTAETSTLTLATCS